MKNLFDAHTHLNFEDFDEIQRKMLAEEIEGSALKYVIDVGDCVASSIQALKDSDDYKWCYAAVGIHPEHASTASDEDIDEIRGLAAHPKARAIGEIGLDFYYGKDNQEAQIELFRKQIRLANELRMPIMVHTRDANQLTMDILVEEGAFSEERKNWFRPRALKDGTVAPDARVQLHCYSGSKELAMEYVKLGATISLGGPITFKNGKKAAEVAAAVPSEYLMSETDAPYLTPEPFRGRQNKSQYVEYVTRRMAILKGVEFEDMADLLMKNGCHFFNIDQE